MKKLTFIMFVKFIIKSVDFDCNLPDSFYSDKELSRHYLESSVIFRDAVFKREFYLCSIIPGLVVKDGIFKQKIIDPVYDVLKDEYVCNLHEEVVFHWRGSCSASLSDKIFNEEMLRREQAWAIHNGWQVNPIDAEE